MKSKFRYEPPVLVDMQGPDLCAEFMSCGGGLSYAVSNSCKGDTECYDGTRAEMCTGGTSACGCDGCCGTGDTATTSGTRKWQLYCNCLSNGNMAYNDCDSGTTTGIGACNTYGTQANTCSTGQNVGTNRANCIGGA
jgi:hypothetical protein